MAQTVCVIVSAAPREQLAAIATDRNRPRKHVERARIVPASADRPSPHQVAQSLGVSRPTVWSWQHRFPEAVARQDAQARQGANRGRNHGADRCLDLYRAAASGDPLDRARDGQGQRSLAGVGAAHLAGAQTAAAPAANLQTLARPRLCQQAELTLPCAG